MNNGYYPEGIPTTFEHIPGWYKVRIPDCEYVVPRYYNGKKWKSWHWFEDKDTAKYMESNEILLIRYSDFATPFHDIFRYKVGNLKHFFYGDEYTDGIHKDILQKYLYELDSKSIYGEIIDDVLKYKKFIIGNGHKLYSVTKFNLDEETYDVYAHVKFFNHKDFPIVKKLLDENKAYFRINWNSSGVSGIQKPDGTFGPSIMPWKTSIHFASVDVVLINDYKNSITTDDYEYELSLINQKFDEYKKQLDDEFNKKTL